MVIRLGGDHFTYHCLHVAVLENGERYAIDFEGIKHGWKELLYPWDKYSYHRTTGELHWGFLGFRREGQKQYLARDAVDSIPQAIPELGEHVIKFLITGSMALLASAGINMTTFLSLPDDKFATIRKQFIAKNHFIIQHVKHTLESAGMPRLYYDTQFRIHVAMSEDTAKEYEKVWLTDEEFEARRGNKKALKAFWKKKLANRKWRWGGGEFSCLDGWSL